MNNFFVSVLLPLPFDKPFTYKTTNNDVHVGSLVNVPFRNKEMWGVVLEVDAPDPDLKETKIKEILQVNQEVFFNVKLLEFIDWIASYNLALKGLVLKAFIGVLNSNKTKKPKTTSKIQEVDPKKFALKELSESQAEVAEEMLEEIEEEEHQVSLLDGVTGSGKTEIYFAAIARLLEKGCTGHEILKQAQDDEEEGCHPHCHPELVSGSRAPQILILLPEIALTSQLVTRFQDQFGFKAALWHSKITPKEKREIFYGITSGTVKVLIGARSALLLPFKNLKLIVIDEEHDASFKQEDVFNFHARDMAILKAKIEGFPVILSSATPSLETYANATSGKYRHFLLAKKYNSQTSQINLIDLRREKLAADEFISQDLKNAIADNLEKEQQTLLFLNRRGYAPVTLCKSCGEKVNCPNCSSYLVAHKNRFGKVSFVCHYCGLDEKFSPDCKACDTEDGLINIGVGAQRIEEEVHKLFPQARTALVTSDNVTNFKEADALVKKIANHEIDIIIGTQLIAKGYDFAGLTLVGIVDADSGFYSSQMRCAEKSYQLLKQVIGRAGRREKQGRIFIQTYNPKNFIFEKIIQQDKKSFYDFEMQNRQAMHMPPFTKMASFIVSAFEDNLAKNIAKKIVMSFPFNDNIEVFGPAPMPLLKLKNRYHYRVYLKTEKKVNMQKLIANVMKKLEIPTNVRIKTDIDPQ